MEVFSHLVDAKAKDRNFQKSRVRYRDAAFAEVGADIKFDLVHAAFHADAFGDRMVEQPAVSAFSSGYFRAVMVQSPQAHTKAASSPSGN